jgi:hypothetical protein
VSRLLVENDATAGFKIRPALGGVSWEWAAPARQLELSQAPRRAIALVLAGGRGSRRGSLRFADAVTDLPIYVLDAPALFDRPGGPYADPAGADWPDNYLPGNREFSIHRSDAFEGRCRKLLNAADINQFSMTLDPRFLKVVAGHDSMPSRDEQLACQKSGPSRSLPT